MPKTIKTRAGRKLILPTAKEESAIAAGIAADKSTYELADEEFVRLKPMRGRPVSETHKVFTAIRFDPDVLNAFKASGRGWQTRMNAVLKEWINAHPRSGT